MSDDSRPLSQIQTQRLLLSHWTLDEAADFHRIWGDPEVIWWGASPSLKESEERLKAIIERAAAWPEGYGGFAVRIPSGKVVGNVMLQPAKSDHSEIEIGWHFVKAQQGQGFATEAAQALLVRGFRLLDLPRIIAPIVPDNVASQRVASKLGMTAGEQIDYAGYIHDVWAITRAEFEVRAGDTP